MTNNNFMQNLKEARRDALEAHYLVHQIPEELADKVVDANSLYEYLLVDTQITDVVKTTPIAEAISSLQLFINRCMEGNEGQLASESSDLFIEGGFLDNWDTYNKRYATWTGKEMGKYYAANYIDPTLREGMTEPFQQYQQALSQGKPSEERARQALTDYLTKFEELSDITYLSCGVGANAQTLYFIGRTNTQPTKYYWRKLTLVADVDGKLIPIVATGNQRIFKKPCIWLPSRIVVQISYNT